MHPSSPPPPPWSSSAASSAAAHVVASRRQRLLVFIASLVAILLLAAPLSLQGAHAERAQTFWTLPPDHDPQLSAGHPPRPVHVNNRIVAVGDLHSDYSQTLAVLRLASIVDMNENWVGGQDTLIQTGDLVDRGPDTIAIFRFFEKLRAQARSAGGEVINLMGNHEVMNIGGDLRYVTEDDYASFGGRQKRKEAWDVHTGWLGKFVLNNFNISHIHHGHTVFSHADMHPEWAQVGVDDMNFMATQAILNGEYRAPIFTTKGPVWNRALASQEGGLEETCKTVEKVKKILGVNRLISGHTPQYKTGKVLSLCGGSYLDIDVGISKYYGGHVGALEIIENKDGTQSVYALYPTGKLLV